MTVLHVVMSDDVTYAVSLRCPRQHRYSWETACFRQGAVSRFCSI